MADAAVNGAADDDGIDSEEDESTNCSNIYKTRPHSLPARRVAGLIGQDTMTPHMSCFDMISLTYSVQSCDIDMAGFDACIISLRLVLLLLLLSIMSSDLDAGCNGIRLEAPTGIACVAVRLHVMAVA